MQSPDSAPLDDAQLDRAFAALADPTRRAILARLARGDAGVLALAEPFAMSQPAVSKHLAVLESAGLVSRRREGRTRPCHLEADRLRSLSEWVGSYREYWERSFERLDDVLEDLQRPPAAPTTPPEPEPEQQTAATPPQPEQQTAATPPQPEQQTAPTPREPERKTAATPPEPEQQTAPTPPEPKRPTAPTPAPRARRTRSNPTAP